MIIISLIILIIGLAVITVEIPDTLDTLLYIIGIAGLSSYAYAYAQSKNHKYVNTIALSILILTGFVFILIPLFLKGPTK